MAIENFGLRRAILDATSDVTTVYLCTGNPGVNGTSNRVSTGTLAGVDIPADAAGWTIHATQGRAEAADDLDYGNAGAAVNGVSWLALFKGNTFYARRELSASEDIANGAPVVLTGSTVVIEFTSSD